MRLITIQGVSDTQWTVDRDCVLQSAWLGQGTVSTNPSDTGNYTIDLSDGANERFYLNPAFTLIFLNLNFPLAAGETVFVRNSAGATGVLLQLADAPS